MNANVAPVQTQPSIWLRCTGTWRWLAVPLVVFLATRVTLLLLAYSGQILVPTNPNPYVWRELPDKALLDGWVRWDAGWYLELARNGYRLESDDGQLLAAVPPLFPLLLRGVGFVVQSLPLAGLLVANGSLLVALALLFRLVDRRLGRETAARAVLLAGLSPFAFFLGAAYPDSLTLAVALGAFLLVERGRLVAACALASLAPLSSPAGLALWPALAIRAGSDYRQRRVRARDLFALALPPLGIGALIVYLRYAVGAPFSQVWTVVLGPIRYGLLRDGLAPLDPATLTVGSYQLTVGIGIALATLALLTLPAIARLLGAGHAVFVLLLVLLPLVGGTDALGRNLAVAFPVFVALAHQIRGPRAESLIYPASALLLGLFTVLFAAWYPVDRASAAASPPIAVYAEASATRVHPQRRLRLGIPQTLLIHGYDLSTERIRPGSSLRLTVYVEMLRSTDDHYLISAHLRDQSGGRWGLADRPLGQVGQPAGLGAGEIVGQELELQIAEDIPSGVYQVELFVFAIPSYERLPLVDWDTLQEEQAPTEQVTVLRREDAPERAQLRVEHPASARFGGSVALRGYDLSSPELRPGDRLAVSLYWEAIDRIDVDYTVFVQVLGPDGKLVAQSDAYPLEGRYPTSRWARGDLVRDVHQLTLPESLAPGTYSVIVGMYSLDTMQRLPVAQGEPDAGGPPTSDYLLLDEVDVRLH